MTLGVLIARQRSGTGALGSVLDQHPDIRYLGEVFHHDAVDKEPNYFRFFRRLVAEDPDMALPTNAANRFNLYADYLGSYSGRTNTVIDVKYSSLHHFNAHWMGILEPPGLFKILRARSAPVIHLQRRNYLKTFVSGGLAELNKEWHAKSVDNIKVRNLFVDPQACLRFIRAQGREAHRVEKLLDGYPRLIDLEYSDMFDDAGELRVPVAEKLAAFFGVTPFKRRKPAFVKQAPNNMEEAVANYSELQEVLNSTQYAWMLVSDRDTDAQPELNSHKTQ